MHNITVRPVCVCVHVYFTPGGPAPPSLCIGSGVSHGGSFSLTWVTEREYVWRLEHQVLFATPFSRAVDTGELDGRNGEVRVGGITFWPPHSPRNSFSCCAWQGFRLQTTISGLMRWSIHYSVLYGLHRADNIVLASIPTSWWKRAMEIHLSDVLFAVFNMAQCRTWNFQAAAGKFGGHLISPHLQVQCIYCVEPDAFLPDIRSWPCGLASHRICFGLSVPAKSRRGTGDHVKRKDVTVWFCSVCNDIQCSVFSVHML